MSQILHTKMRLSCARISSWLAVGVIIICLAYLPSKAGSYDEDMPLSYSGMVKPEKGMGDYNGQAGDDTFSTAYLGRYAVEDPPDSGNWVYFDEGTGNHPGVDIWYGNCEETPIRAVAEGEIVWVGDWTQGNVCGYNFDIGGWGNAVIIRHQYYIPTRGLYGGTYDIYTVYSHLSSLESDMIVGRKVLRGTTLGYEGSTGGSTGSHLHFQVQRDWDTFAPYWPSACGCCDNVGCQEEVETHTFNPMYFVQAHLVNTQFDTDIQADYFLGIFESLEESGFEPEIDHEWFDDGPEYIPQSDQFSVRWGGIEGSNVLYIPNDGTWFFFVTSDDGFELWIDGEVAMLDWNNRAFPATFGYGLFMEEGFHQIRLDYFEEVGNATIQLAWLPPTSNNSFLPLVQKVNFEK